MTNEAWLDTVARRLAARETTRRDLVRLGGGGALAGLALGPGSASIAAATCRLPKKPCRKRAQCCTGRCKKDKCVACANGATLLLAPDLLCWLAWGGPGGGNGQFESVTGVAVGDNGHVYVADSGNSRIQEFDLTGVFVRTWGGRGTGNDQFGAPSGVAVGGNGHVYVADADNHRIQEFSATGGWIRTWGGNGGGTGKFDAPLGLAVGGNGHVYVADSLNHRIQEFSATGGFIGTWGGPGGGNGQFDTPTSLAVGDNGHVYVADTNNHRVQEFDANLDPLDPSFFVQTWGGYGNGVGQFAGPRGVAVGRSGGGVVADRSNDRIQEFDAMGGFVRKWGGSGSGDGQLNGPHGVAVGLGGKVYVADTGAARILRVLPL